MISFKQTGDFKKTSRYLRKVQHTSLTTELRRYAQEGVDALSRATPVDSGETAASWYYEIRRTPGSIKIEWKNSNIVNGVPIAIILQYGHATGNGGYVQGRDYINPAIQPVFDRISESIWKELSSD